MEPAEEGGLLPIRSVQRQDSKFDIEDNGFDEQIELGHQSPCSPGEVFSVELCRPDNGKSFGFNIDGGSDRPYLDVDAGIFITHVRPDSVAADNGNIDVGDKILEVNGKSVIYASHDEVVSLFKSCGETVKLTLHKSAGVLLRSGILTEESADSGRSTPARRTPRKRKTLKSNVYFSPCGFIVGIALGVAAIYAVKRMMTSRS